MSAEQNKQAQIILEYKKQALNKHLLEQPFFKGLGLGYLFGYAFYLVIDVE
jgi:hypothetical protein